MEIKEDFKSQEHNGESDQVMIQTDKDERLKNQNDIGGIEVAMFVTGLSKSSIYQRTSKGTIPHFKPPLSNRIYFSKRTLENWIKSGERGNDLNIY